MRNQFWLLLTGIALMVSCGGSKESSVFDRKPILENVSANIIIPTYEKNLKAMMALDSAITSYKNTSTPASLSGVKEQWINVARLWKHAELFNFGPIESMFLESAIDYWPTDTAGIEKAIANYTNQDDYLVSIGSNKKGIAALEYLLFHKDEETVHAELSQKNRLAYLQLLAKDLVNSLQQVLNAWKDEYQKEFISKEGNKSNSSLTLLTNEMVFLIERVKNDKLSAPYGKQSLYAKVNPSLVEAPYSQQSLQLMKENILAIKEVFLGKDGKGIDDYLNALEIKDEDGKLLSEKIIAQFDATIASCEAVESPLIKAVETEKEALDQLYLNIINLTIILKNDMMSQLGLLVIFSDNDGD